MADVSIPRSARIATPLRSSRSLRKLLGVSFGLAAAGLWLIGADHWGTAQLVLKVGLTVALLVNAVMLLFPAR